MTTRTGTLRTHTLAVVTIAIAGVALTGCSLLGDLSGGNTGGNGTGGGNSSESPGSAEGTDTDVFTVKVGDCLNNGGVTGEVSEVKVTKCNSEHDSEAYKRVTMTDGAYPGSDVVAETAVRDCGNAFTNFIGLDSDSSSFDFSYYYPTEESWAQGDREILCLVYNPDGKTAGSLEGSAK